MLTEVILENLLCGLAKLIANNPSEISARLIDSRERYRFRLEIADEDVDLIMKQEELFMLSLTELLSRIGEKYAHKDVVIEVWSMSSESGEPMQINDTHRTVSPD